MVDAATRRLVQARAGDACEYCGLRQEHEPFVTFPVEHIIAKQHGGNDEDSNLCLACTSCNLHKGPNVAGIDSETGELVSLFNPREDDWDDHFQWQGPRLVGKTAVGRITVSLLGINLPQNLELRKALIDEGAWQPD